MNRKELFRYLKDNEETILAERKSKLIVSDSCIVTAKLSPTILDTTEVEPTSPNDNTINVKVVASTANTIFFGDLALAPESYEASIAARGTSIPHIADHKWEAANDVGDVQKIYTQDVLLSDLGLSQEGSTTALIFETSIRESYNPKVYLGYKNKKINQHSIGFSVLKAKLAINSTDPEDVAYKANWDKYYSQLVNASEIDAQGYFIYATEIDIIENSAVMFGANSLTPTLQTASKIDLSSYKASLTPTALVEQGEKPMTLDEALKKISDLETEMKTASALATKAERERTVGILEAAKTFNLDTETAIKAINKAKWDVEDVVDFFTTVKAAKDASVSIDTSMVPFGKGADTLVGSAAMQPTGLYIPQFTKGAF